MRQWALAAMGTGIALAAWLVFTLGSGLVAAAAFMTGIFAVLVTLGIMLARFVESHSDRAIGWMWRSLSRFDLTHRRNEDSSRCALCRKPMELAGGLRVCVECDLVRTNL